MSEIRRVRCPFCKQINLVDIETELKRQETYAIKALTDSFSKMKRPAAISITCSNQHCQKDIIVKLL